MVFEIVKANLFFPPLIFPQLTLRNLQIEQLDTSHFELSISEDMTMHRQCKTSQAICEASKRLPHRATFLTLLCAIALSGCSNSSSSYETPEALTPLKGTVTLDGAALTGATLSFIPQNGTSGIGGYAITDESGAFEAQHQSTEHGLPPGNYAVTFSKLVMPDGNPIPEGQDAADVGAVQALPDFLSNVRPEGHPYQVTVASTPQTVQFELDSKKRRR